VRKGERTNLTDSLTDRIDQARKAIDRIQKKRDTLRQNYPEDTYPDLFYRPETSIDQSLAIPWNEYQNLGRELGVAQSVLASLLLEKLDNTTTNLDADVKSLDADVKSLGTATSRLNRSSKNIETLTSFLLIFTAIVGALEFINYFTPSNEQQTARAILAIIFAVSIATVAIWNFVGPGHTFSSTESSQRENQN
jgi:hypothetical protein